jgi:hypothetical protein
VIALITMRSQTSSFAASYSLLLLGHHEEVLELIVRALVRVVEVSGVKWVGPRERVVDLGLAGLALPYLFAVVVAAHQAQLVHIVVIVILCVAAVHWVFVTREPTCRPTVESIVIDVCGVDLLVTFNELIHLLRFVFENISTASLASGSLHLHLLLEHHDLVFLVGVFVIVVGVHVQPLVLQHFLCGGALVRIPLEHGCQKV